MRIGMTRLHPLFSAFVEKETFHPPSPQNKKCATQPGSRIQVLPLWRHDLPLVSLITHFGRQSCRRVKKGKI